jgi:hypothetical protein
MAIDNETLLRRWFDEVWNEGRVGAIDELMAPDCIVRGLENGGSLAGSESIRAVSRSFQGGIFRIL